MTRAWIAALLFPLTACGGGDASEDVEALEEAGQEQADRYSSGDYAGAWDMWTDDAKAAVSEDAYVSYSEACAGAGAPIGVTDARIDEPGTGIVRIGLGDIDFAYTMEFEGDEWRWVPTDETLERFADGKTAEEAIAEAQQSGDCIED